MTIETCVDLGDYFRSLLLAAMRNQRVTAAPETEHYVTGVLVTCAVRQQADFLDRPLVMILDEALAAPTPTRGVALQSVGNGALCMSGLFSDNVARRQLDPGLYVRVGSFAYREAAALARDAAGTEPVALVELGEQFPRFVDVLSEVAEAQALGAVTKSIVALYDRFKRADSQRAAEEMARRGTFPARGGGVS